MFCEARAGLPARCQRTGVMSNPNKVRYILNMVCFVRRAQPEQPCFTLRVESFLFLFSLFQLRDNAYQ